MTQTYIAYIFTRVEIHYYTCMRLDVLYSAAGSVRMLFYCLCERAEEEQGDRPGWKSLELVSVLAACGLQRVLQSGGSSLILLRAMLHIKAMEQA